jgi:hypothetical protein
MKKDNGWFILDNKVWITVIGVAVAYFMARDPSITWQGQDLETWVLFLTALLVGCNSLIDILSTKGK